MESLAIIKNSHEVNCDAKEHVRIKINKYLKANNLRELSEALFDVSLREYSVGYEILDFLTEENFCNKGFYRFLMLKVSDIARGNIDKYLMQINENSRERFFNFIYS